VIGLDYNVAKKQSQEQIPEMRFMMATHPEFRTTKRLNLMRLRDPKNFPYAEQSRLFRDVTKDVIEVFHELNTYIYLIPVAKRMEVFESPDFTRFVDSEWLSTLHANDVQISEQKKIKEYDASKDLSYQNYYNLFSVGITGIIKAMPEEFQTHIAEQLIPMMKLMQSIARFSGKDVPYIHYPEIFNKSSID